MPNTHDIITPETAVTLAGLFRERVKRSPDNLAYRDFDRANNTWRDFTWAQMYREIGRWQAALMAEGLERGDCVALMMCNCTEWITFDQAALGLDLPVVPLYTVDRPDNVAYIVDDAKVKILLLETQQQWQAFQQSSDKLPSVKRILISQPNGQPFNDDRVRAVADWLPKEGEARCIPDDPHKLASIIYTSGTTGKPKGVMLSHHNMLSNAHGSLGVVSAHPEDMFLSFLPLSHTFERTCGYLSVMAGAKITFARSIALLSEDLQSVQPTLLISVPRIYERIYAALRAKLDESSFLRRTLFQLAVNVGWCRFNYLQHRGRWHLRQLLWPLLDKLVAQKILARLGGKLRIAASGGAALPPEISHVFLSLGVPLLQGYGMTETSPVISSCRLDDNVPGSVGKPIEGVEVRLGINNVLLVKGPNVMLGYWNNAEATQKIMLPDGWLNTGDVARIDEAGHIFITGRTKEIIVLSNGEKIPPGDMEAAILRDPIFDQVIVVGEAKPFLTAIVTLNAEKWAKAATGIPSDPAALKTKEAEAIALQHITEQIHAFPGYAQIRRVILDLQPWTIEKDLMTPTLKIKRPQILQFYEKELKEIYAGH